MKKIFEYHKIHRLTYAYNINRPARASKRIAICGTSEMYLVTIPDFGKVLLSGEIHMENSCKTRLFSKIKHVPLDVFCSKLPRYWRILTEVSSSSIANKQIESHIESSGVPLLFKRFCVDAAQNKIEAIDIRKSFRQVSSEETLECPPVQSEDWWFLLSALSGDIVHKSIDLERTRDLDLAQSLKNHLRLSCHFWKTAIEHDRLGRKFRLPSEITEAVEKVKYLPAKAVLQHKFESLHGAQWTQLMQDLHQILELVSEVQLVPGDCVLALMIKYQHAFTRIIQMVGCLVDCNIFAKLFISKQNNFIVHTGRDHTRVICQMLCELGFSPKRLGADPGSNQCDRAVCNDMEHLFFQTHVVLSPSEFVAIKNL